MWAPSVYLKGKIKSIQEKQWTIFYIKMKKLLFGWLNSGLRFVDNATTPFMNKWRAVNSVKFCIHALYMLCFLRKHFFCCSCTWNTFHLHLFSPTLFFWHDFCCCCLLSFQPPLQVKTPAGCPDLAEYIGSILIPHTAGLLVWTRLWSSKAWILGVIKMKEYKFNYLNNLINHCLCN